MSDPTSSAAPGWYPDPYGAPALRWWDGAAWSDHVSPLPGVRVQAERVPIAEGSRIDTVWIWLIAVLPLTSIASFFLLDFRSYFEGIFSGDVRSSFSIFGIGYLAVVALGWIVWGAGVFFASRDWRGLQAAGVVRPFHWAWAFLGGIVYLIGRTVIARKVTKTQGLGPLWVGIAVYVAIVIASIVWSVWLTTEMMQTIYDRFPGSYYSS